jgi:hypothetical protein
VQDVAVDLQVTGAGERLTQQRSGFVVTAGEVRRSSRARALSLL